MCPLFERSGTNWVALHNLAAMKVFLAVNALEMDESEKFTMEATGDFTVGDTRGTNLGWKVSVGPKNACLYSAGIAYLLIG